MVLGNRIDEEIIESHIKCSKIQDAQNLTVSETGFSAPCLYHVAWASQHFIRFLLIMYCMLLAQKKVKQGLKRNHVCIFMTLLSQNRAAMTMTVMEHHSPLCVLPSPTCHHELYHPFKFQHFLSLQLPILWLSKQECSIYLWVYTSDFWMTLVSLEYIYLSHAALSVPGEFSLWLCSMLCEEKLNGA